MRLGRKKRVLKVNKNMFIEEVKKNIGKEIKVVFFNSSGKEDIVEGVCEAIDFIQRSVIIRTPDKKILIPRYKFIERVRSNPEVAQ